PRRLRPAGAGMSSPVSSRRVLISVEGLCGAVSGGVVGGVGLPAFPDHVQPGAGEDAHGVWVVVPAGAGAVVELGGPGAGVAGVAGEVADGVAVLFVRGPAEADDFDLARLSGRGRDPGQADQAFGCGEAAPGVADLSEQSSGADLSAAGQAGEDVCVWVQSELFFDLVFQRCDLGADGLERGDEGEGDLNAG